MSATTDDKAWQEEFALALRLTDATGAEVGEALAEVEAHLADSGQSAADAFGDPRAYAASLPVPKRRPTVASVLWPAGLGLAAYLGVTLVFEAVPAWPEPIPVRVGTLVAVTVVAVASLILGLFARSLLATPKLGGLIVWMIVGLAAAVLPGILWRQVAFTVPAWLALLLGLVLIVGAGAQLWRTTVADRIVDPRPGRN